MKLDIDNELQGMIQNTVGILIIGAIVITSMFTLGADAVQIALALGGGVTGFLGGRIGTNGKSEPPKKIV